MNVPEINVVKDTFEELKVKGLISDWELPYENILTRRSAAIFFLDVAAQANENEVWDALEKFEHFSYRKNTKQLLSGLTYQVTFSEEAKEENGQPAGEATAENS